MQRVELRALEYTIIFEIRPTPMRPRRFPIRSEFQAEFFTRPIDRNAARWLIVPMCMRVWASNIGKQLNPWGLSTWSDRPPTRHAYMSRRRCTRAYSRIQGWESDGATRTYLWKAAGIHMPDGRRVIISHARCYRKIWTSADLLASRQNDDPGTRGYATLLCNRARSLSIRYICILHCFTRSDPFVSLLFPRGASVLSSVRCGVSSSPLLIVLGVGGSSQLTYRPVIEFP